LSLRGAENPGCHCEEREARRSNLVTLSRRVPEASGKRSANRGCHCEEREARRSNLVTLSRRVPEASGKRSAGVTRLLRRPAPCSGCPLDHGCAVSEQGAGLLAMTVGV